MIHAYITTMSSVSDRHTTAWAVVVLFVIALESGAFGDSFSLVSFVTQPIAFLAYLEILSA